MSADDEGVATATANRRRRDRDTDPVPATPTHLADTLSPAVDTPHLRNEIHRRLFGDGADPVRIGRYPILYRVGAGGMGVVYAGYDKELDRKVAIKLLRRGDDAKQRRERLAREAKALARFSHPGVVQVYEAGTFEDNVYLAMEFVEGETLRAWQDDTARTREEIISAYLQAGRGLMAAHEAGLVHRDFKPDNAIVGRDGRVRVLDFGVARETGEAVEGAADPKEAVARLTKTGALVGTPAYMAPEQWHGRPADARTDQFSFAVSLWEAVYGERPFKGESMGQLVEAVVAGRHGTPWRRRPGRLERALMRALAADPAKRFADMEAMLRELEPLVAKKRRALLVVGGLLAVALVAAIIGLGGQVAEKERADALARQAEAERNRASLAEGELRIREHELRMGEVRLALERDPTVAAALLGRVPPDSPAWSDGSAWEAAQAAQAAGIAQTWVAIPPGREPVELSTGGHVLVESRYDGGRAIWTPGSGRLEPIVSDRYAPARFSPDARWLWTIEPDGEVKRWDTSTAEASVVGTLDGRHPNISLDGRWARAATSDATQLLPLAGGPKRTLPGELYAVAVSTDGARTIGSAAGQLLRFTEDADPERLRDGRTWHWHDCDADVRWFAVEVDQGGVALWNTATGQERVVDVLGSAVERLRFRPGHDQAAAVTAKGEVGLVDLATLEVELLLDGAHRIGWSGDGSRLWAEVERGVEVVDVDHHDARRIQLPAEISLATFADDGALDVVDVVAWRRFAAPAVESITGAGMVSLAASPSGVAALHRDGTVRWWGADGERVVGQHDAARSMALALDSDVIVTGGEDGLRRWELPGNEPPKSYAIEFPMGSRVAVSPDGRRAGVARTDGAAELIDLVSSRSLSVREPERVIMRAVFFSRPGDTLYLVHGEQGGFVLDGWDAGDGSPRLQRRLPSQWPGIPLLRDDGRFVVGGAAIELMAEDGSTRSLLPCPTGCRVQAVSLDGRLTVSRDWSGMLLTDLETGRTAKLHPPADWLWPTFSPDGTRLYFLDSLGQIRRFPVIAPMDGAALQRWVDEATTLDLDQTGGPDWKALVPSGR